MYSNLGVLKGFIYREGGMGNQGTSKATVLVFTFPVFLNSGRKERKSEKEKRDIDAAGASEKIFSKDTGTCHVCTFLAATRISDRKIGL